MRFHLKQVNLFLKQNIWGDHEISQKSLHKSVCVWGGSRRDFANAYPKQKHNSLDVLDSKYTPTSLYMKFNSRVNFVWGHMLASLTVEFSKGGYSF